MLKILVGVGLGFLLFTNPEARQITADLLRATASAIAPEQDNKTFQDRVKEAVVEKVMDGNRGDGSRAVPSRRTEPFLGVAPPHDSNIFGVRLVRSDKDRQDDRQGNQGA